MKTSSFIIALLTFAIANVAQAVISFNIKGEDLNTSAGAAAPTTTLAFLVADTSGNGFSAVQANASTTVGTFLNGSDDKILGSFDLSSAATAGVLTTALSNITIAQNTPLALYWFPTLTLSSSSISSGTTYGRYVNGSAVDGSSAWIAPADGTSLYKLFYYNTSATVLNTGGTNTAASGNASLTVAAAPEPNRMMLMGLGLGAFFLRRRRMA